MLAPDGSKPITLFGIFVLLVGISPIAFANYSCVGPVSGTQIAPNGVVMANTIAGIGTPYLCSVNTTTKRGQSRCLQSHLRTTADGGISGPQCHHVVER
jgi:hypothetical protein